MYSNIDLTILEDDSLSKAEKRSRLALVYGLSASDYQIEQEEREERRSAQFIKADPEPLEPVKVDPEPLEPAKVEPVFPERVKIWAEVGLSAIKGKHGGAWRAWVLAHSLDQKGAGWVEKRSLWEYFAHLGIGERKRWRWVSDALKLGLLIEPIEPKKVGRDCKKPKKADRYYLAGLAAGAIALGSDIGKPAEIGAVELVKPGWRSVVWAAYLVTLKNRPISQAKKAELTGVSERVQRNYQSLVPGGVRRNYAKTGRKCDRVTLTGIRDNGRRSAFIGYGGEVFYRLPDIRFVPVSIARSAKKGRSKKAQKIVNKCSLSVDRANDSQSLSLFHETEKGVKAVMRELCQKDILPWDGPAEVFQLLYAGNSKNIWLPVAVYDERTKI